MKNITLILSVIAIFSFVSCNNENTDKTPENPYDGLVHQTYVESMDVFPNPERGFYSVKSYHSASDMPLSVKSIQTQRKFDRTIFYIGYYPKEYMDGDIAEEFLNLIRTNMQALRDGGAKCVLRFAYSDSENEMPWDPTPDINN